MPRNGTGESDNLVEAGNHITHGAPTDNDQPTVSGVDRSSKAAPAPDHPAGAGLEDAPGSAGGSQGIPGSGSGKGALKSTVEEQREKLEN